MFSIRFEKFKKFKSAIVFTKNPRAQLFFKSWMRNQKIQEKPYDVKCESKGKEQMIVEFQSCCRATFATNIPSKVPMVVGTHSCCQIHRRSTMHPVEEKRAATADRSSA